MSGLSPDHLLDTCNGMQSITRKAIAVQALLQQSANVSMPCSVTKPDWDLGCKTNVGMLLCASLLMDDTAYDELQECCMLLLHVSVSQNYVAEVRFALRSPSKYLQRHAAYGIALQALLQH